MIIRRARKVHVPIDRYGWIEASAEIEFDTEEFPEGVDYTGTADHRLTILMEPELEEICKVAEHDSFIQEYRYTEEGNK